MNFKQTDVIIGVDGIEDDPERPQTGADTQYVRVHARTVTGQLDVRLSVKGLNEMTAAFARYFAER